MSRGNCPKVLRLWFATREYGRLISGIEPFTAAIQQAIKSQFQWNINAADILAFPRVLQQYPKYEGLLYRGVPKDTPFYTKLKTTGSATTDRYYSCSSSEAFARCFGQKVLLVFEGSTANFNVSALSREQEIILDKGVCCTVTKIEQSEGYEVLYLQCT
jgi:hypothetical protein